MDSKEKENSGNILDIAKDTVSTIADKVVELKEDMIGDEQTAILGEFKEAGLSKIKQTMNEIGDSVVLISKSGYDFKKMEVSLGIPPSVSLIFHYEKEITAEEKMKLEEEANGKKIVGLILKCLFKANQFYHSANIGNYKIDEVKITLGFTPGVDISFEKK